MHPKFFGFIFLIFYTLIYQTMNEQNKTNIPNARYKCDKIPSFT